MRGTVAAVAVAALQCCAAEMSAAKRAELSSAFLGLDASGDGVISAAEAARGLQAVREPAAGAVPRPRRIDRALCAPSVEPSAFLDCVAARARLAHARADDSSASTPVEFDVELQAFMGGHDDTVPPVWRRKELTCDELVESHRVQCSELQGGPFCRLSCGEHERHHFERQRMATAAARRRTQVLAGPARNAAAAGFAQVLVSSDWHLEPFYDTSGAGNINGDTRVSRFNTSLATLSAHGTCRSGTSATAPVIDSCPTTGAHDPPLAFGRSHFEAFASRFPDSATSGVFFFIGDGQSHEFHQPFFLPGNADMVAKHAASLLTTSKQYFPVSRIFWVPGNNDGPHSSIFLHRARDTVEEEQTRNAISSAWAEAVVASGVVSDVLQREYHFVLEPEVGCQDDLSGHIAAENATCAEVAARVGALESSEGRDACGCSGIQGMTSHGCADGKNTNPNEAIDCSCVHPFDDPEELSGMVGAATAPGSWARPERCLAPGGNGDGCVTLAEECPVLCGDCLVPVTQVHETGLSPVDFFRRTGYFMKQLDRDNELGLREAKLFVIILNTNLGAANLQQTVALVRVCVYLQHRLSIYIILT